MKYLLIANPISGPKKGQTSIHQKALERIENAGHSASLLTTEYEGHGYELALKALDSDYDVIVAIGGDGTVNEVARALTHSDKVLGIIPNGSGNGLARELQIPLDTSEATKVLLENNVMTMDTCTANGDPFFVTCGIGFDGKISKEFAKSDTRGLTTYAKEAVSEYFNYHPNDYHLLIDGKEVTATAFLIAIGNASQYGYNAYIAPNASRTDGVLDLTILTPFPHIEATKIAMQLFTKGIDRNEYAALYKGKHILIETPNRVNYHIDGEPKHKTDRLEIEVCPTSLQVVSRKEKSYNKSMLDLLHQAASGFYGWTADIKERFK